MASKDEQITDVEKGFEESPIASPTEKSTSINRDATLDIEEAIAPDHKFLQSAKRVEHFLGLEARGIHRVKTNEQTERTTLSFLQIVLMWISINTASQNITLASIGQSVYGLGFADATLCSVFGAIVGSIPVAYTAGWGPWSGNRTMVFCSSAIGVASWTTGLLVLRSAPAFQWGGGQ
jgi:hypothetical protein